MKPTFTHKCCFQARWFCTFTRKSTIPARLETTFTRKSCFQARWFCTFISKSTIPVRWNSIWISSFMGSTGTKKLDYCNNSRVFDYTLIPQFNVFYEPTSSELSWQVSPPSVLSPWLLSPLFLRPGPKPWQLSWLPCCRQPRLESYQAATKVIFRKKLIDFLSFAVLSSTNQVSGNMPAKAGSADFAS